MYDDYGEAYALDFGSRQDYRRLDIPAPRRGGGHGGRDYLLVTAEGLERLAAAAFEEIAFRLPTSQLEGFASILSDPSASEAERFVAASLIRNAAIAAEGLYPLCQDTGVALAYGWWGDLIALEGDDRAAIARGAAAAYGGRRLRASVLAPESFTGEANTGNNLPLQADIRAARGDSYRFCFAAKGGGSSNRTSLGMESPALLSGDGLERRLAALIGALGASGCPPYRITCVLGGLSPAEALRVLDLAGLGLLDVLPREGSAGRGGAGALRSPEWESRIAAIAAATGAGAQFGGSRLALDARAIRLPRHAASLPLAFGVSCAASRHARAFVDEGGFFLERMEEDPARFLPKGMPPFAGARRVSLDGDQAALAAELGRLEPGSTLLLSGLVVAARDQAHARFRGLLAAGKALPRYLLEHPVFYAGPTEAAPGRPSGSFGPTTSGRMDAFLASLLPLGASLVSIGKGGRSPDACAAIAARGGAYLCAIGGAAALAGSESVIESEVIDYPELGMEAVRLVRLQDLPAIVGIDGKGGNFYARQRPQSPSG
jgi:fumarate hydratase class I